MGIIARQSIKNNILLFLGVGLGFVNVLIIQPLVLRPEQLGLLRLMLSIATLMAAVYPLGLNSFTIKYFPVFKNLPKVHGGYLGFLLLAFFALFSIGAFILLAFKKQFLLHYGAGQLFQEHYLQLIPLTCFVGLFLSLTSYSSVILKTTVPSFLNEVVLKVILALGLFAMYYHVFEFDTLIQIQVYSYLFICILLFYYFYKTDGIQLSFEWKMFQLIPISQAVQFTLTMGLTGIATIAIRNIDAVFIANYLDLSAVAVYAIAMTICSVIDIPGNALQKILLPKIAQAFKDGDINFIRIVYYKSVRIGLMAGSFLFLLLFTGSKDLLFFLPKKYQEAAPIIQVISVSGIVNMVTGLNFNVLQYSKYYRVATISMILLALFSAVTDVLLIPRFGLIGAAFGTSLAIILINLFVGAFLYNKFNFQPFFQRDLWLLIVTIVLAILLLNLPISNPILALIVKSITSAIGIGIIAYFNGDWKELKQLKPKG